MTSSMQNNTKRASRSSNSTNRPKSSGTDDVAQSESSSSDNETTPLIRHQSTQEELKQQNPHYLCPHCNHASRIAANLIAHHKRSHKNLTWDVKEVLMVQDGQSFKYGDRHLHVSSSSSTTKAKPQDRQAKDWTWEAVYGRVKAKLAAGVSELEIRAKTRKALREHEVQQMSVAELDDEITRYRDALTRFPAEAAHAQKVRTAEQEALSRGRRLANKVRGLFGRKEDKTRSRSPNRPTTAIPTDYRSRSPIPGSILRRPSDIDRSTIWQAGGSVNSFDTARTQLTTTKSVSLQIRAGETKKPGDDSSVSESEVSEEE